MASRLHRLISILDTIRFRRYPTADRLCREFQVKPRTLFNDLKELREVMGFDIQFDRERGGYFLVGDGNHNNNHEDILRQLPLDVCIMLVAASEIISGLSGEDLASTLRTFIKQALNKSISDEERLLRLFKCIPLASGRPIRSSIFLSLCRARLNNHRVEVTLVGRDEKLLIDPHQMVWSVNCWFLRGVTFHDGASVELEVSSIASVRVVNKNATPRVPDKQ